MADFIQLKKDNILRFGIQDADGVDTGEFLEFDLEDIELPLKINEAEARHRKNIEYVRNQFIIIDKKEDKKGKFLLSWKEEEKLKILNEYYKRETEALEIFLGVGAVNKLLNGRKPYFSMYDDINDMLAPILPKIEVRADNIINKIKSKYKNVQEKDVLK